jgi:hypothetical protein
MIEMPCNIFLQLQGGLGNQLFQYAAGLAAKDGCGQAGTLVLLPAADSKHSDRDYRIALMPRGIIFGSKDPVPRFDTHSLTVWQQEDAFEGWHPSLFRGLSSVYMKGYFQNLPPILDAVTQISSDILSAFAKVREDVEKAFQIRPEQTAFIHVRRGDYLAAEKDGHWNLGEEYYAPALHALLQRNPNVRRVLVITNDAAWCEKQPWFSSCEIIREKDELISLFIMSLCHGGAVIANSTFSWWGSMLGPGVQPVPTLYPRRWFRDSHPDIFLPHWQAL